MKLKSITYTLLFFKLLIIFNPNIMYAQHRHTPEKSNIPFFKKLILLFDSKQHQNKRYLKQYEKTGNILRLEQYIGSPEMQQRQHAINPFTYYIVKGIVAENKEKGCPKEAFWFYSAALEIDEKELRTCLLYTSPSPRDIR